MTKQIAIIGAGIAGLAAAYDLNKAGYEVTILERAPQVGGLASGFKAPHWDWTLEKFYHHWFQSDEHMLGFIEELGWSDQVLFPRPYTVVYYDGQFQPLDSIPEAARFTLKHYSIIDFMRFGFSGLYSAIDAVVEAAGKSDRRCLAAQIHGRQHLQSAVAAHADRQVR